MTKKLFVVLVVITVMLISLSFVIAANKAPIQKGPVQEYERPVFTDKQTATSLTILKTEVIQLQGDLVSKEGIRVGATQPAEGTATQLIPMDKTDLCDMYGFPVYYWTDIVWGLEAWANFQDPYQFAYGCADVFPFLVQGIQYDINFPAAMHVDVQGYVYTNAGTDCPMPGAMICSTAIEGFDIPSAGWFSIGQYLVDECCVYEPYFAVIYIFTDFSGLEDRPDFVEGDDGLVCQSYNYYGGTWYDCVIDYGGDGMILLSSWGQTRLQNTCTEEPVCCQFVDSCNYMTPTDCLNAGGTPSPDARYECIEGECKLPWVQDECNVVSVDPLVARVCAGDVATFTVTVEFVGDQDTCLLSVTPDPACTDCGAAVFTPNPVMSPSTTSTLTIQTAATTPAGRYAFEVNGAKFEAYIDVFEPADECKLALDFGAGGYWYYNGWAEGDQNAIYYDPAAVCVCCETPYPFYLHTIKGYIKDHAGLGTTDVIIHMYDLQDSDPCLGPGVEFYSFETTIDVFSWNEFEVPVPEKVCINGPFFLSLEYLGTAGTIPSLLWDGTQVGSLCEMFGKYAGDWYDWNDLFGMEGYLTLYAVGTCGSGYCAPGTECNLIQDNGSIASLGSFWGTGWKQAKYYDPEDYCTPPVYPYNIQSVSFGMYDYFGTGSGDYQVGVYVECQDSCDGPGTRVYLSPTVTFDAGFPAFYTVTFPDVVCMYEPFFVTLECVAPEEAAPQLLYDNNPPMDTCHTFIWYPLYAMWIEHWEFWAEPAGMGHPMVRVSGYTEHGDCDPPPCAEDVEKLAGGTSAVSIWTIPDAYGDDFFNERFDMPVSHGGRLDYFEIAFYADYSTGTPDPDFYVWLSDGTYPLDNNPPYQAIADFHIAYEEIVWFSAYTTVQTYSHEINFDAGEQFHIGYSHAQEEGDVLALLGTGNLGSDRSSEWWGVWGTMLDDWGYGTDFLIHAYICPGPEIAPTFKLKCKPSVGYATPGDPPVDVYQIDVESINAYDLPVTLTLLSVSPADDITATFTPNGQAAPFTSDVAITVGATVPYGDYTLTFQGEGTDAQIKTCNVTLTVQPPFDEDFVEFYHGHQMTTNTGGLGDCDVGSAFWWYGSNYLCDGGIVTAIPWPIYDEQGEHMAMDVYDCERYNLIPTQHMVKTDSPWCPGPYEEYYGEIAYSNYYTDPASINGEYDSLFVIGLKHVESTDFSIKIKIFYNPDGPDIPELWCGVFEDWDIGGSPDYADWGDMDTLHNCMWQYEDANPSLVFGIMKCPFDDQPMHSMVFLYNYTEVYTNVSPPESSWVCGTEPDFPGPKYLYKLMTEGGYRLPGALFGEGPDDHSTLIVGPPFSLNQGEKHIEIWIDFGRDLNDGLTWEQWYHKILRYVGFYRGDVNASDTLELPALDISDLVYLINYLYKGGPEPQPFADQANVDGSGPLDPRGQLDTNCPMMNVDLRDFIYLVNYVYKGGPAPVDYVRFIEQYWSRESLFLSPFNQGPWPE